MRNMDTTQKTKGKKNSKVIKNKSEVVMENSQPNSNQRIANKKRKHNETEDENAPVPLQKKSKRKHNSMSTITINTNDQNPIISQDFKKVVNIKKVKRKSEISTLSKKEPIISMESGENLHVKKTITPTKTRKRTKNSNVLSANTNSVEECKSSDNIISPTAVTEKNYSVPKKYKKKAKQCDINSIVPQNGELYNATDILNNSNMPNSNKDTTINTEHLLMNSVNNLHQKLDIDIVEEPLMDVKTDVTEISFNNLNNNEREIKREVNVIDIKNEGGEENPEKVVTISIRDIEGANTNKDEDELLKQLERKLKPKMSKETINWPDSDIKELLKRMEMCIPPSDNRPYGKCLEEMEWDNIVFKSYTIEDCRNMWSMIQKKVRKYRILNEVLQDAKHWIETHTIKTKVNAVDQTKVSVIKKKGGRTQRHPDMPRKPLTAYILFYLENRDSYLAQHPGVDAAEVSKDLAQKFKILPLEEKKKYEEISLQKKEEYKKKLEEFYEAHPEVPRVIKKPKPKPVKSPKHVKEIPAIKPIKEKSSPKPVKEKAPKPPKQKVPIKPHPPFHYFYISELEKETVDDKTKFKEICKERWKQLPERNKLVWIHYAEAEIAKYEEELKEYIKQHPDYVKNPFKPVLSKEDMQIKDRAAGKPSKPPGSAYNLFAKKLLQSHEIKKVPVRDRLIFVSNQWKYCNDEEKNYYKEMYDEAKKKYKEEFNAYLESLPEDERKEELKKVAPKIIKPENEKTVVKKEVKKKKELTTKTDKKSLSKSTTNEISQQPEKLKEPQQPPISPFKYYSSIYSGGEPVVQAWKALTKQQKKVYEEELIQKKRDYIRDFEKFLKSLSEEELEAFSKSRRKAKEEKQYIDEEESDSYDSDESSEDEDDDAGQEVS